ncbi:aryl-sulfate sulfotransferase [candidate division KSB1 bacterium]|nr:aryl-sulfate sulfotransferase [candidate division KSB1 bacterium]
MRYDRLITHILLGWFLILSTPLAASDTVIQYLFPVPGSGNLPCSTPLIMRFWDVKPEQIDNLDSFCTVTGNQSGSVSGHIVQSSDGVTLLFKPDVPFNGGETVTVHLAPKKMRMYQPFVDTTYHFQIQSQAIEPPADPAWMELLSQSSSSDTGPSSQADTGDPLVIGGVSVPSTFPKIQILANNNPDTNYLFISYSGEHPYHLILDNSGTPVYYQRLEAASVDFKRQQDGRLSYKAPIGVQNAGHLALDSSYAIVDTFYVPAGYHFQVNMHELQVLPNDHYLLIGDNFSIENMSGVVLGGHPAAQVICNHIIEMDADDNPIFIWNAREHFNILDAPHVNLVGNVIDFIHVNAIEIDLDGHILISCRHLETVIKINRQTGAIIWQLGGANDDFTWTNDTNRISYQHDIRVLPNGNYTLFDNGNYHSPPFSRALELSVNTQNWTVTKVWAYRNPSGMLSQIMGNVQRLNNGNTLINWGPTQTEVTPNGSVAYLFQFINAAISYRVLRFPWDVIAPAPHLIIEPQGNQITLLFNKFGDLNVNHYNIYAGQSPNPGQIIASSTDPFIHLSSELENNTRYFFRVTGVNSSGIESGYSNEESLQVQIMEPGQNMIQNGDFSQGMNYWRFYTNPGTQATSQINEDGEAHIHILSGGSQRDDISLRQNNLLLLSGKTYRLELDIYASSGRLFEILFRENNLSESNLTQTVPYWITQSPNHLSLDFSINKSVATSAQLVFNAGGSSQDVYIDNIVLILLEAPVADYSADLTEGIIPLSVQFADQSIGTVSTWYWEFGDGESSKEQNPVHTYQSVDTFSVSLTVSGPGGEDTKTRTEYIEAFDPSDVEGKTDNIPDHFELSQNYPNPFNASTTIHYAVPEQAHIRLAVYNVRGECVYDLVNGQSSPGNYQIHFDASLLGSGLYFYRLESISNPVKKNVLIIRKMILLR